MFKGKRVAAASIAVLAILAGSERHPAAARATYTLSGSPDGTGVFYVNDDLDVYVDGNLVYSDNVPPNAPEDHQPISIDADIGDVIEFQVRDTYGICARLTTVFLTDASGRSIVADPGFDLGCGRPAGNLGIVHTNAFTIPDLSSVPIAEFVAEIRPGAGPTSGSAPSDFAVFQNALYFAADDGVNGRELWRLGTTGGPALVYDLATGSDSSSPQLLTVAGARLYFVAGTPASGRELWQYDGVSPPTIVEDIQPGSASSNPIYLTAFGDQIVFRADFPSGDEPAAYSPSIGFRPFDIYPDSTPGCDPQFGGCGSAPYGFTVYNSILYFGAAEPAFGGELYQYDGTTYQRLTDIVINGSASPEYFTPVGNRLVFAAYNASGWNQLYSYDIGGLPAELVSGNQPFGAYPQSFTAFNGRAYFTALDPDSGRELWSTDGTQAGTSLVADIDVGSGSSSPRNYIAFNGELYFTAVDQNFGNELRATTGTSVRLVTDLNPGPFGSAISEPAVLGPFLIFEANAGGQLHPWFTTGATITDPVRKADGTLINPSGDAIDDPNFVLFNGALYFAANDGTRGYELWRITLGTATPTTPTTTTLVSSPNPSQAGETITLTAMVTGAGSTPTGTVDFLDGATSLGSATLLNGVATLTTNVLSVGSHQLTATYNGSGGDAASTSPAVTHTVNGIATSTDLVSSLTPSIYTQLVTFTATVTGGTPMGDVTFFDGVTPLATIPLVNGSASYATSAFSIGTHGITANYLGDAVHSPSTSNLVSQVVSPLPTSLTLTSSLNPSTFGEFVTFTAVQSGFDNVAGDVVFSEGGVTLATVAFTGNTNPAFATSTLSVGPHTITVTYGGDATHAGSSDSVVQVVNAPNLPPTPPVANPIPVSTNEDTPVAVTLAGSDVNGDPITFEVLTPPGNGILSGSVPNLTYTPNLNYNGSDSFTYRASDGTLFSPPATVSITVFPVNDPPVAVDDSYSTPEDTPLVVPAPGVLGNDTDAELSPLFPSFQTAPVHGTFLPSSNGAFTYTPPANFNGTVSFTYRAVDGTLFSNLATVTITVTPVNDAPVANNDSYSTTEGIALTVPAPGVLANDVDVDLTAFTPVLVSGPANGSLTLNADGSFTYTPAANYSGQDGFTYQASDGAALSNVASVTIVVVPRTFTWTSTGDLGGRRRFHTATLLRNGKVLVAGGYTQGNTVVATAELYDPVTGTWTSTGSMIGARAYHTATLLPNGQVLVAGGQTKFFVTTAEIYDPLTGSWSPAGNHGPYFSRHTATLLLNGKVLVAGGFDGNSVPYTGAALYDPATGMWSATASLGTGRNFHTATLLSSGRVLVAGGYSSVGATTSVEVYDSATGVWTNVANLTTNRSDHSATLLPNGKVLVAGGGNNSIRSLASAELYDPINNTWTPTGGMGTGRAWHTATLLPGGFVLVAGGITPGGATATSELYDPTSGQWRPTANLIAGRYLYTATLLQNGKVLAVGGASGNSALSSAELYGPIVTSTGSWRPTGSIGENVEALASLDSGQVLAITVFGSHLYDPVGGTWQASGALQVPRFGFGATPLADGRVLVVGGITGGTTGAAEIYDPATGTWTATGSLIVPRSSFTTTLLANGRVLVAGGFSASGVLLNSAELYDPATGTWTATGNLVTPRSLHTATLLATGQVLVAGGASNNVTAAELFDPTTGVWTTTGSINTRRSYHTATRLSDGRVLIVGGVAQNGRTDTAEIYDPTTRAWTSTPRLTGERADHTATLLPSGRVLVAGGLDKKDRYLASAELYDPAANTWTTTAPLIEARAFHRGALLATGEVLVVGGFATNAVLRTAELYTP